MRHLFAAKRPSTHGQGQSIVLTNFHEFDFSANLHGDGVEYNQPPRPTSVSVKIWTEEASHLSVDVLEDERFHNRPFLIETPCCEALNPVLLESDMHPGPEISPHRPYLLTTPNTRFLPHIRCQSESRQQQSKVYIPTISRFLDALISQHQWLKEREPYACRMYGPATDVSLLIRYLFLEMPSQRVKILPLLEGESRAQMEEILDRYKRTYKNKLTIKFAE